MAARIKTRASVKPAGKASKPKAKAAKAKKPAAKQSAAKKPAGRKPAAKKPAKKAVDNRRRFDRRETRIDAELEHGGRTTAGAVTNISLQGCLFTPVVKLPLGTRVKLKLSGESKPVAATVKAISDQGVHCLLHAGGATLGRLSTGLDDMALLMLSAGRPTIPTSPDHKPAKK